MAKELTHQSLQTSRRQEEKFKSAEKGNPRFLRSFCETAGRPLKNLVGVNIQKSRSRCNSGTANTGLNRIDNPRVKTEKGHRSPNWSPEKSAYGLSNIRTCQPASESSVLKRQRNRQDKINEQNTQQRYKTSKPVVKKAQDCSTTVSCNSKMNLPLKTANTERIARELRPQINANKSFPRTRGAGSNCRLAKLTEAVPSSSKKKGERIEELLELLNDNTNETNGLDHNCEDGNGDIDMFLRHRDSTEMQQTRITCTLTIAKSSCLCEYATTDDSIHGETEKLSEISAVIKELENAIEITKREQERIKRRLTDGKI